MRLHEGVYYNKEEYYPGSFTYCFFSYGEVTYMYSRNPLSVTATRLSHLGYPDEGGLAGSSFHIPQEFLS